jgi:phage terminase large subunit-like protein
VSPRKPRVMPLWKAAKDKRLLGAQFAQSGLELWPKQIELLRSLEGPERTHLWAIGRQASKTTLCAMTAVHNAAMRPDLDLVLPKRKVRYVLVIGPGLDQGKEFIEACESLIVDSPVLSAMAEVAVTQITFNLPDGRRSRIRALPASAKTTRGMSASLAIYEEHAHFDQTSGPGSDERVYKAVRPSLRRFAGAAKVLSISTPSGQSGKFYQLFLDASTGVLPSAAAVKMPTWAVDPTYDQEQQDADRAELGEDGFAEEIEASFISGRGSFFDVSAIDFAEAPAAPSELESPCCGVDVGLASDFFGVAVVGRSYSEPDVLLVGAIGAIDPAEVRVREARSESLEDAHARESSMFARAWAVAAPYSPTRGVADSHKGGPLRSYFGRLGCDVELVPPTATLQMQQFVALKARLEDGSLRCWAHPQLIQDLRRVRTTDGGKIYLPKFRGSHCDTVVALASAVWEFSEYSERPAAARTTSRGTVGELYRPGKSNHGWV